jgi:hypothetical protein
MRLSVGSAMSLVDINRVGGIPEVSKVIYNLDSLRNIYNLWLNRVGLGNYYERVTLANLCIGNEKMHLEQFTIQDADLDQKVYTYLGVRTKAWLEEVYGILMKSGYVTSGGRSISMPFVYIDRVYDPIPYQVEFGAQYCLGRLTLRIISDIRNLARFASVITGGTYVIGGDLLSYDSYSDATATLVEKARIDFGSVYNIRKFANRVKYYISASATGNLVRCEVSADGTTWTTLWQDTAPPTSETEYYYVFNNLTNIRYVRWLVNSGATTSTIYLKIYPLFAWEG